MHEKDLYDARFVRALFDEMAATYGVMNLVSSFGFAYWWRRQCVRAVRIEPGGQVVDLMCGMGELFGDLGRAAGTGGAVVGLDLSPVMCRRARAEAARRQACPIRVFEGDALRSPLADGSADYVFSTFGLKTFSVTQTARLAAEIARVLRPGGQFSLLEISVPGHRALRFAYLAYLEWVIPVLGKLFMGNPDNYRLLGVYTRAFGSCAGVLPVFRDVGLEVELRSYFFGCATGWWGARAGVPRRYGCHRQVGREEGLRRGAMHVRRAGGGLCGHHCPVAPIARPSCLRGVPPPMRNAQPQEIAAKKTRHHTRQMIK